jgi:hypothetical protein
MDAVETTLQDLARNNESSVSDVTRLMRGALSNVLARGQQNLTSAVQEGSASAINDFTNRLGNQLADLSTAWIDEATGNLAIVPEGTRYLSREDKRMNVVVEQAPMCRRVKWMDRYFYLALPYVQYIGSFTRGDVGNDYNFAQFQVTCSRAPIQTLQSRIFQLPMSNIGMGTPYQVCLGHAGVGMTAPTRAMPVHEKMNTLISGFWQSRFNTDLITPLFVFLRDNFGVASVNSAPAAIYAALEKWEEKSRANPLFMLEESISLQSAAPIGSLIASEVTGRNGKIAFRNRIRQTINQNIEDLTSVVTSSIRNIDITEDNVPRISRDAITAKMRELMYYGHRTLHGHINRESIVERTAWASQKRTEESNIQRNQTRLTREREAFKLQKTQFDGEKLRAQIELHAANEYLKAKTAEAEAIIAAVRAGLPLPTPPHALPPQQGSPLLQAPPEQPRRRRAQRLDENGNPVPPRRRSPRTPAAAPAPVLVDAPAPAQVVVEAPAPAPTDDAAAMASQILPAPVVNAILQAVAPQPAPVVVQEPAPASPPVPIDVLEMRAATRQLVASASRPRMLPVRRESLWSTEGDAYETING